MAFQGECRNAHGMNAGQHLTSGSNPFHCIRCGAVDQEEQEKFLAEREAVIECGARKEYQTQVQGVAIQLLQMFMTQNMMRDLGQIVRDTNTTAPRQLSELLDLSISGAIHFVTEVNKLKPRAEFVEQYKRSSLGFGVSFGPIFPPDDKVP